MSSSISKPHVVKLHLKFLCDSKQLEQQKREKHRWAQGGWAQGGRAGATTPAALHQESLSTAQGWPCQLCSHSCYWILSQPEELANSAFQAQSLHWDTWAHLNAPAVLIDQRQSMVANSSCFGLVWNALKQMITDRKCYSLKKEKRKGFYLEKRFQ